MREPHAAHAAVAAGRTGVLGRRTRTRRVVLRSDERRCWLGEPGRVACSFCFLLLLHLVYRESYETSPLHGARPEVIYPLVTWRRMERLVETG
jgi:hypothetical protein